MNKKIVLTLTVLTLAGLLLGACSVQARGNPRETMTVEGQVTEAELQGIINESLADPLIRSFTADMREGYTTVTAERERLDGSATDTLTFRLDLGVSGGHLTASISDARLNGNPIDEPRVALWNERIANRLERAAGRHPNSTLQSVTISGDVATMVWQYTNPGAGSGNP
jgi:hypothetical protein